MPQPNTHYLVIEEALKYHPDGTWQTKSNFAGFGSFGPDLFYVLGVPHVPGLRRKYPKDYTLVSDVMHWEASLDFFCCMLDDIKHSMKDKIDKDKTDKQKAFAYGYYSHVVTDAVFHPFIYRRTKDRWEQHFTPEYNKHKKLESLIDAYQLGRRGENPYTFGYQNKVECHKQGSGRTLDEDVFKLLHHCLAETYGRSLFERHGIDYQKFFGQDPRETRHPILEAYRDFISSFRKLYGFGRYVPQRLNPLVPITRINKKQRNELDPEPRRKWYPSDNPLMPDYSVPELFEFAVKAMKMVIDASERFFSSDATSARAFFSQNAQNVVFLDDNYNFDTGLPSSKNPEIIKISGNIDKRFDYGLDMLSRNYRTIDAYVV